MLAKLPKSPGPMDAAGRAYWFSIGTALIDQGRLPLTAIPMFFQLCSAWSEYLSQQAAIKKLPRKARYHENGKDYSAPYRDYLDSQKRYNDMAKHFGLDVMPVMQTPTIVPPVETPQPAVDAPKAIEVQTADPQPLDISKSAAQFESTQMTKRDRAKYQRNDYRGGLPIVDEQPTPQPEIVHHRVEIFVPSAAAVAEHERYLSEWDSSQPVPEQFVAAAAVAAVESPSVSPDDDDDDEIGVII